MSPASVLATALLAGLAAALGAAPAAGLPRRWRLSPRTLVAGAAVGGVVGLALLADVVSLAVWLLVVVVVGAGLGVVRLTARTRGMREAERRTEAALAACESLAGDLRAGQPPVTALERVKDDWSEFAPVASAARLGADVPQALRRLAMLPGAAPLAAVAAAWEVAHRTGGGLASAVASAGAGIRDDLATRRMVRAELASAEATARMLAILPLGVLLLGSGVGGNPFRFLLATVPGVICLGLGLCLSYAGMVWLNRLADQVTRAPGPEPHSES